MNHGEKRWPVADDTTLMPLGGGSATSRHFCSHVHHAGPRRRRKHDVCQIRSREKFLEHRLVKPDEVNTPQTRRLFSTASKQGDAEHREFPNQNSYEPLPSWHPRRLHRMRIAAPVDFDGRNSRMRLRCAAAKNPTRRTPKRMALENLLQSNQALVIVTMLAFLAASMVSRRSGLWSRSRTVKKAAQVEAARTAAVLARLRFVHGPGRAYRGLKFWHELFADLEHANREDALSWEVVLAVTEAVQADTCRTAKLRAVIIQRPDAGLIARASTLFAPRLTPRRQKLARWSGRRAREVRVSVHSSSSPSKNWRTEEARTRRPFLGVVQKSGQRILSN